MRTLNNYEMLAKIGGSNFVTVVCASTLHMYTAKDVAEPDTLAETISKLNHMNGNSLLCFLREMEPYYDLVIESLGNYKTFENDYKRVKKYIHGRALPVIKK